MGEENNNFGNEVGNSIEKGIETGAGAIGNAVRKGAKKLKENAKLAIKTLWNTIPIEYRLIIIAVIAAIVILFVLLCAAALYILDLKSDDTSTDEKYNSVATMESTDITNEASQLLQEEIQSFISNYNSDNETLKTEMLNKIDVILQWQEQHGYSAAFLITVAFEEDERVENFNFDTFFDDINIQAGTWKEMKLKTIKEIAEVWILDDTANEWANNIENNMPQDIDSSAN